MSPWLSGQSPEAMLAAVTDSMWARTGRTLPEWTALVAAMGVDPLDQRAVRAWLKEVDGLRQNSQWGVAFAAAEEAGWVRPDAEVAALLRAAYDQNG